MKELSTKPAPRFTPQQTDAIETLERNLIVTAGAGSGKTAVLVERFLNLLEVNSDWPIASIVAITYTEKAAREMRDRIRQRIEQKVIATNGTRWHELANGIDSARISTIHALCASILRANAAEAGIDPGFTVVEDLNAALYIADSISDVLAGLAQNGGEASSLLLDYPIDQLRRALTSLVGRELPSNESGGLSDPAHTEQIRRWKKLVSAVQLRMRELKGADTLDFDDLERMTRDLLRNHPGVRARYQSHGGSSEFRHLMIDEYQDTSPIQRDIVHLLTGDHPGAFFAVGDPKQSIYQFRGADVSIFRQTRDEIVNAKGRAIQLGDTFRAHTGLANAFNDLFARLFSQPDQLNQVEYDTPMNAARQVEGSRFAPVSIHLVRASNDDMSVHELRAREAVLLSNLMIDRIVGVLPVWDKDTGSYRPAAYSDVVVLSRKMTHIAPLESAFRQARIPYVTQAGRGYFDRPEVRDLLDYLRALVNAADDLALAVALRSPLFAVSDEDLFRLRLYAESTSDPVPSGWLRSTLMTDTDARYTPAVQFARECTTMLSSLTGRITTAEMIAQVVQATGYTATLIGLPNGEQSAANIEKLIETARANSTIPMPDFLRTIEQSREREVRESEALIADSGAVRLMTVHASKGLEFPIVILRDTNGSMRGRDNAPLIRRHTAHGWTARITDAETKNQYPEYTAAADEESAIDAAQALRLLYVGMTRAQDYVILSGSAKTSTPKTNKDGTKLDTDSWLGQIFSVLGLPTTQITTRTDRLNRPGWTFDLNIVDSDSIQPLSITSDSTRTGWDILDTTPPAPIPGDLLALSAWTARDSISITPSVLSDTSAPDPEAERRKLQVQTVVTPDQEVTPFTVNRRIVGTIIHRLVRTYPPHRWGDGMDLSHILKQFAWSEGLIDPHQCEVTVDEAVKQLYRFQEHSVFTEIQQADEKGNAYYEIPASHRVGNQMTNLVIDVLYLDSRRDWRILDYKTAVVSKHDKAYEGIDTSALNLVGMLQIHAQRYQKKMEQYGDAVKEIVGQVPKLSIFYVRYGMRIDLKRNDSLPS